MTDLTLLTHKSKVVCLANRWSWLGQLIHGSKTSFPLGKWQCFLYLTHQPTYFHLPPTLLGPPRKPSSHNLTPCWRRIFCKSCYSQCFVPSLPQQEHLFVLPPRSTDPSSFSRWVVSLPGFHSFNSLSFKIIHTWLFKSSVFPDFAFQVLLLVFLLCVKYVDTDDTFISGLCIMILDCQAQFLWNSTIKTF